MSSATRSRIPRELIDRVIESVLDQVKLSESSVDKDDVTKIKAEDGLLLREILNYLDDKNINNNNNNNNVEVEVTEESVKKITSSVMNTLKWRASYRVNEMKSEDFPTAFYSNNPFTSCRNLLDDDTVILVQDNSVHEKVSNEWNEIVQRFWIYFTETVTSQYFNQGKDVLYLMNFTNFGVRNLDSNLCLSFYDVIGKYYPRITLESNAIDMPWYAKPVMKLVLKVLPPSIGSNFKTISRKDLASKLGSYLPESLGGENDQYQPLKSATRHVSIQEVGEKNGISQEDIDKMVKFLGQA